MTRQTQQIFKIHENISKSFDKLDLVLKQETYLEKSGEFLKHSNRCLDVLKTFLQ